MPFANYNKKGVSLHMKKALSLVLLVSGICAFAYGSYLSYEVAPKEQKLSEAEQNIQEQRRPVLGPIRRNARAQAMQSKESAINSGEQTIAKAHVSINWLRGTGIILFIIGSGCLIFCSVKKK